MELKNKESEKKKMRKTMLCLTMVVSLILNANMNACAKDMESSNIPEYQESYFYINFNDIDIELVNEEWELTPKSYCSRSSNAEVVESIEKFENLVSKFPDVEENILSGASEEELVAASFTEVPLTWVDGHYERITTEDYAEISEESVKGNFVLYTKVFRSVEGDGYRYAALTYGSWSANSILGGADYPASGDDYVYQTAPNTFTRYLHDFMANYNGNPYIGVEGEDYWLENGDISYIKYGIADDPLGVRQNTSFSLCTNSLGPASNEVRHIGSYYVHTWKSLNVSVSVAASTEKSVTLSLTPSLEDKCWQVYNYVPFQF